MSIAEISHLAGTIASVYRSSVAVQLPEKIGDLLDKCYALREKFSKHISGNHLFDNEYSIHETGKAKTYYETPKDLLNLMKSFREPSKKLETANEYALLQSHLRKQWVLQEIISG